MLAITALASLAPSIVLGPAQSAPPPELIADIELTDSPAAPASTLVRPLFEQGGDLYFSARVAYVPGSPLTSAAELWATDGSPAGTRRVQDFASLATLPGSPLIMAAELPGDRFVFTAESKAFGNELFLGGSNVQGTPLIVDLAPDFGSAIPTALVAWRGYVWFLADDATGRRNLWRTDGTAAGTVLDPVTASPELEVFPGDTQLIVAGDQLFVTTAFLGDSLYVKSDPGVLGVGLAGFGGGLFGGVDGVFEELAVVGSRLVFTGSTGNLGIENWVSDGTLAGTFLLTDIAPGAENSRPSYYGSDGTQLWFNARTPGIGRELWVTDGTPAGTTLAWGIAPGSGTTVSKFNSRGLPFAGGLLFTSVGASGNEVRFLDAPGGAATVLLTTSGMPANGGYGFMESGGRAYFFTDTGADASDTTSMWVTDGTPSGTQLVGSGPLAGNFASTGLGTTAPGFVFGGTGPEGVELRTTLGTPATTALIVNLSLDASNLGSWPLAPRRLRDGVVFSAQSEGGGREPYFSDGSSAGTIALGDLMPQGSSSNPLPLAVVSDALLFAAESPGLGTELWRTDGTPAGTELVADLFVGPSSAFRDGDGFSAGEPPAVLDGLAYFFAETAQGAGLWSSDGTVGNAFLVKGLPNAVAGPEALVAAASLLFFRAQAAGIGSALWVSDGTTAGTNVVTDLTPGPGGSGLGELTAFGERVLYRYNGPGGQQLGISDGTAAGSIALGGTIPGATILGPQQITVVGDLAIFSGLVPGLGRELCVTDGTPAGTQLLLDLEPGQLGGNPLRLTEVGDLVYFFASVTAGSTFKQTRLWVTDGTAAGTRIVDDAPGEGAQFQANEITPLGSGGKFLFSASNLLNGTELWISDGTEAGTRLLADLAPGPQSSFPAWAAASGNRVLLAADNGVAGQELYAFALALAETWLLEPFGDGCGAQLSGSGTAQLGGTATLELSSETPGANTFLFFSLTPGVLQFGKGCTQYLVDPGLLAVGTTDAQGTSSESLAVPNFASVIGLELYFQALIEASGGPLLGAFELSNGVEAVIGE